MKTKLEIVCLTVFNKDDADPPTKLTASYKGWWHLPKLHVPLALELLKDNAQAIRKDGTIALVQRFPSGEAPTFRVKGRNSQLEIRLYAGRSLRTHAKVTVGDLVSSTAGRVVQVPFQEKPGGKVAKGFLSVAQIAPAATQEVFGDHNDSLGHQDHQEKDAHQSPKITSGDCDEGLVKLWNKVFADDIDEAFVLLCNKVFGDH